MRKLTEWLNDNPIPESALVNTILRNYSIDEWPELIDDLNRQGTNLAELHHIITQHASWLSSDEIARLYTQYISIATGVTLHGTVPLDALTDKMMWKLYNDHYALDELMPMINELVDNLQDREIMSLWSLCQNDRLRPILESVLILLIGDKL